MLKRTTGLRRTTRLRPRSAKTAGVYVERRALVERILRERKTCQWPDGCKRKPVDVHERLTRARGGSILDEANLVALCREHHSWVHDHPQEAHEKGLLQHSWEA